MQHRAQRINIGPRTLFAVALFAVLFNRRKAWLEHDLGFVREVANLFARRAEIQQHRQLVFLNLNVIQRDIAVQIARLMNGADSAKQRRQQLTNPRLVDLLGAGKLPLFQAHAAVKQRAHISGAVLFPETQHVQQAGMIKTGQQARFLNKAGQPGGKQLLIALAAQTQRHIIIAYRQRQWHVLFDGDGAL